VARASTARAAAIFRAIDALGFAVLAARIAKRFRMTVEEPVVEAPQGPSIDDLRREYARIRHVRCYDGVEPREFDAVVRAYLGDAAGPADFVAAASTVACPCKRCRGTGEYVFRANDGDTRRAECFRCGGKGTQDLSDAHRNRAYDAHRRAPRGAVAA